MTRNEARTEEAWRSFDLWSTFIVPLLLALPALYLWKTGYGAGATGCCAAPAVAVAPAVVAPPVVVDAPVVTPPATAPAVVVPDSASLKVASPPVASAPVVDCAALVNGVSVAFAIKSARLTGEGRAALDRTVTCLGSGQFEVAGHTDAEGSDEDNRQLSMTRARAVVRYLISRGVPAASLAAAGYGESQPIADNATAEGRARNRRIAFTPK